MSTCHRNTERERKIAIASWPAKRPIAHQPSSQKQNLVCFEVGLLLASLPGAHRGETPSPRSKTQSDGLLGSWHGLDLSTKLQLPPGPSSVSQRASCRLSEEHPMPIC